MFRSNFNQTWHESYTVIKFPLWTRLCSNVLWSAVKCIVIKNVQSSLWMAALLRIRQTSIGTPETYQWLWEGTFITFLPISLFLFYFIFFKPTCCACLTKNISINSRKLKLTWYTRKKSFTTTKFNWIFCWM